MSQDKAQELGLVQNLEKEKAKLFVLGNQKIFEGIGTVSAHVSFAQGNGSTENILCYFNVLERLAVSILIGESFPRATETLSKYRDRLIRLSSRAIESTCRRVFAVGNTENELVCMIDGKEVLALADTGAEVSLMRGSAAQKLGISYQLGSIELVFADGSIERTSGFAHLSVSLGGRFEGHSPTMKTIMHIFENLICDVLIDKTLIEGLNVFALGANRLLSTTSKICFGYICAIKVLTRLEKWFGVATAATPQKHMQGRSAN